MKIIIAGDLVPTEENTQLFENGNIEELLGKELIAKWQSYEYKIFNLETPICSKKSPIEKCGPSLIANPKTIEGIKKLKPTVITLANNHIMDQGVQGYKETISLLTKNNIEYVGVGENTISMKKAYTITDNGKKTTIFACCESEFSGATKTSCGANLYDEFNTFDDIKKLKEQSDRVIVLYHGAKEYYRYPSPRIQKLCRKFVDSGADVVICQHSHCIGSMEEYKKSKIVYGQGNFIFDHGNNEYWATSLLLGINFDKEIKIEYIPITKIKEKIRMVNKDEKLYKEIMDNFIKRSEEIKDEEFVLKKYKEFASLQINNYLSRVRNKNFLYRAINKAINHKLPSLIYRRKDYYDILNSIECEAHRELFIQGLKSKIGIKGIDE